MSRSVLTPSRSGLFLIALIAGCGKQAHPLYELEPNPEPRVVEPDRFHQASTGTIRGTVVWSGSVPEVPPFHVFIPTAGHPGATGYRPTPNAPRVDPASRGVEGAIVFLRGVDSRAARPWDHSRVRVELSDRQIAIRSGAPSPTNVGIVRLGDSFEMVSMQPEMEGLRGRGADFFTLMLPDPDRPLERKPPRKGLIELTSPAHHFWQRAYLFVDDHPYYTRTDRDGRFTLAQVPPGRYEVVCWLPNWKEIDRDRDPETCQFSRLRYGPPVTQTTSLAVEPGGSAEVTFTVTPDQFRGK
jgi:Polysaccharide lyase family 4, domain II